MINPSYSMVALIQSENHASNKGKTAGRYQFDTHPTGIGLNYPVSKFSGKSESLSIILLFILECTVTGRYVYGASIFYLLFLIPVFHS